MATQPSYKLLYLNLRGFGEPIRLLLHYKGINFEDKRFDRNEFLSSPELKKLTPYGRVPVLEIEGQPPIAQSGTILRFLARKFDLEGKNDSEVTKADEIYGYFADVIRIIAPYLVIHVGLSPGDKDKVYEESFLPTTKEFLPIYNKLLNESKSGYLLPSGLTYIDFVIAEQLHTIVQVNSKILDDYPELAKYKERVHSLPGVKEYVSGRPESLI